MCALSLLESRDKRCIKAMNKKKNRSVSVSATSQCRPVFEVEEVVKNSSVSVSTGHCVELKRWSRTGLSVSVPVSVWG